MGLERGLIITPCLGQGVGSAGLTVGEEPMVLVLKQYICVMGTLQHSNTQKEERSTHMPSTWGKPLLTNILVCAFPGFLF